MRYSGAQLTLGVRKRRLLEFSPHIPSTHVIAVAGNLPKPRFHFVFDSDFVVAGLIISISPVHFTPEKECYTVLIL
jgi:hypothetical protein